MRVYIGRTRSSKLKAEFQSYGWGEMVSPTDWPPSRHYALDNGAFVAWTNGQEFNTPAFLRLVERAACWPVAPDFLIAPDIVAGGARSLEFSLSWVKRIQGFCPLYLAVQDGMTPENVAPELDPFAGVFVGGSTRWKIRTAENWAALAHGLRLQCHVGRVGTARRVRWAHMAGIDSIDSTTPLWKRSNLEVFRAALSTARAQTHFFFSG